MPSGPDGFVAHPRYVSELTRARELLLGHPGRWRVIYHYDGDGIGAASALLRALQRLGYGFQATALAGVERGRMEELVRATSGPLIITDTGATWPDLYSNHPHPVIVLDHHSYPGAPDPPELPAHVAFVNPVDWGVDGMGELCAATLAWLFTVLLDPRNWDNARWGLSGAIHDRQHLAGFRGLNRRLVDEALRRGLLTETTDLNLRGPTVGDALAVSVDPYLVGLSSRPEAAGEFLQRLDIRPDRSLGSLEPGERRRLASALLARLVRQGTRPEFCERVTGARWLLSGDSIDAEELSSLQNAAGRAAQPGTGVALAFGDSTAFERCRSFLEQWRTGVLHGLRRLEDEGVRRRRALQWFATPDGPLAGTQAGLAITYFLDPRLPVFALTRSSTETRISARGTPWLVDQGLDLATVCREAAARVGGEGGGHRVASGASVPVEREEEFLDEADRLIAQQLPASPEGLAR